LISKYFVWLFQAEKETRAFLKSSIQKYYVDKDKDAVTIIWDYIMAHVRTAHHWPQKQGQGS
jgi:hypothetical protein